MAQQSLVDAFEDCINRLADGQSLEECLNPYPAYHNRLRPMLEATIALRQIRVPETQIREDQALVWQQIIQELPVSLPSRRRGYPVGLLAAVLLLLFVLMGIAVFLSRPQLPPDDNNIVVPTIETVIPTLSITPSVMPTSSPSWTPTLTVTTNATYTLTATLTATPMSTRTLTSTLTLTVTATNTRTPAPTLPPTATFAPGCGAPLTEQDAINSVLEIYPNTSVTSVTQTVKFGSTLVWEVQTSHNIEVNIDVACGIILTIVQSGNTNTNTNSNDNISPNPTSNSNDNSGGGSNSNDNSSNDNSGMGSSD